MQGLQGIHQKGEEQVSRFYEMSIAIKDYKPSRLKQIQRACSREWDFAQDDFIREKTDPLKRRFDKVIATAQGSLCGGEEEHEFANRLVSAIWKANGGVYCYVEVQATCLEELPHETFTYDEDDFAAMTGT